MAMRESFLTRETARRALGLGMVGALGYSLLTGCGTSSAERPRSAGPTVEASVDASAAGSEALPFVSPTPTVTGNGERSPMLVFDDLGGGSPLIKVYRGPGEDDADRESTGAYRDGEAVNAICKRVGRAVESDVSVGEAYRIADEWVQIESSAPDVPQFATATYVENPDALLAQLDYCPEN